jgi:hypothetical protein
MRTKSPRQTIEKPSDIVSDTAILLQRVGVVKICEKSLLNTIHGTIDAQALVTHAANLFVNRGQQGLITFESLLGTLTEQVA